MNIIAVVVTYNRKELLEKCLYALHQQTLYIPSIVVIDNASTDGTEAWFQQSNFSNLPQFTFCKLDTNTGGAGGFNLGLKYALDHNYDWAWIMDDDAYPEVDAFEALIERATNPENIYGSIAINGDKTCWDTPLISNSEVLTADTLNDIPDLGEVTFLPFLGFFISTILIKKIGLPDSSFFISGDDLEYCLRAKFTGAKIFVIGKSKINHPKADIEDINFLGFNIRQLIVPPWKNYYNVRNKLLIAKKYYPNDLLLKTLPGIALRLITNLLFKPQKAAYIYSSLAGIIDGLLSIKGRRHTWWKITR